MSKSYQNPNNGIMVLMDKLLMAAIGMALIVVTMFYFNFAFGIVKIAQVMSARPEMDVAMSYAFAAVPLTLMTCLYGTSMFFGIKFLMVKDKVEKLFDRGEIITDKVLKSLK